MGQVNVNPGGSSDSGMGGVLAVLLAVVVIAFLVWALAFGGFASMTGRGGAPGASSAPAANPGTTVNVAPNVNVQPSGGAPGNAASKP